jgi:hypothetical protein
MWDMLKAEVTFEGMEEVVQTAVKTPRSSSSSTATSTQGAPHAYLRGMLTLPSYSLGRSATFGVFPPPGILYTGAPSTFFDSPEEHLMQTNFLWCFWLYNAVRLAPSLDQAKIEQRLYKHTERKLRNVVNAVATRIFPSASFQVGPQCGSFSAITYHTAKKVTNKCHDGAKLVCHKHYI